MTRWNFGGDFAESGLHQTTLTPKLRNKGPHRQPSDKWAMFLPAFWDQPRHANNLVGFSGSKHWDGALACGVFIVTTIRRGGGRSRLGQREKQSWQSLSQIYWEYVGPIGVVPHWAQRAGPFIPPVSVFRYRSCEGGQAFGQDSSVQVRQTLKGQ